MKVSKDALRMARQMLAVTVEESDVVDEARARDLIEKVIAGKPRGYIQVLETFLHLLRLEMAKRHAEIQSAVPVTAEVKESVSRELASKYGEGLSFEFVENADLLGGIRVKVGSDVWDGSVQSRLQRLKEAFQEN